MLSLDALRQFGANTDEGLQRCFGNEQFYFRLVKMMPGDANFQKLYDALDSGDLAAGFEAAHALKGALGNLALTALYDPVQEITELLRSRTEMDYGPLLEVIRTRRDQLAILCED